MIFFFSDFNILSTAYFQIFFKVPQILRHFTPNLPNNFLPIIEAFAKILSPPLGLPEEAGGYTPLSPRQQGQFFFKFITYLNLPPFSYTDLLDGIIFLATYVF